MIKIAVFDSALSVISKDQINTGAENYYEVAFVFNETWDSYSKYAVFYQVHNQPKLEVELSTANENGEYIVRLPNELLVVDIPIYVGTYGTKTDNGEEIIISSNFKALEVETGAFGDNLVSFDNNSASIVRSVNTKVKFIRENDDGDFEYSTDGVEWKNISFNAREYEAINARIDELQAEISSAQDDIRTIQNNVSTGYARTQTTDVDQNGNPVITYANVLTSSYKREFLRSDWHYDSELSATRGKKMFYIVAQGIYHRFSEPYLSNFTLSRMVNKQNEVIIDKETCCTCLDFIDSNKDVYIYVDVDLDDIDVYTGKIIIKGEINQNE